MRMLFIVAKTCEHFYPVIAVIVDLNCVIKDKRLIACDIYYISPNRDNYGLLIENGVIDYMNSVGKIRRYFYIFNFFVFFFNDTATTEIYTLSLHDALPILFGSEAANSIRNPSRTLNVFTASTGSFAG